MHSSFSIPEDPSEDQVKDIIATLDTTAMLWDGGHFIVDLGHLGQDQLEDVVRQAIRDITEHPSPETYQRALHLMCAVPDTLDPQLDWELADAVRQVPDHCKVLPPRRT